MKQALKKLLSELLYPMSRKISSKQVSVLMYHKVKHELFVKHIELLKSKYNLITINQLIDYVYNSRELPNNSVLISFDDGYLNNYEIAYPILKQNCATATIFLSSGLIGTNEMSWYDKIYFLAQQEGSIITYQHKKWNLSRKKDVESLLDILKGMSPMKRDSVIKKLCKNKTDLGKNLLLNHFAFMNWNQIVEMKGIVTYGSHTVNHHILTTLSKTQVQYELEESKKCIEMRIRKSVLSLAYPNGNHNKIIQKKVKELGYSLAFTTSVGKIKVGDNPFALPRIPVNINDSYKLLAIKIAFTSILYPKFRKRNRDD